MNIGIDVDGVLNNIEEFHLNVAAKFFEKKFRIKIHNPEGFDVKDVFNCTKKQRDKFWIKHIWGYCMFEPIRSNASDVLMSLHNEGDKIYIITSRVFTDKQDLLGAIFRFMLKHWLKKNKIYYDDICFCSDTDSSIDKTIACENYKIDVMIEDKKENIITISKKCRVLCFDAGYNKNCNNENVLRVYDWKDIYKKIDLIKQMKEEII